MKKLQLATLFLILIVGGCAAAQRSDANSAEPQPRDTQQATIHNQTAAALLAVGKLAEAEEELKAALAADLFCGPAHNNLGIVYYKQKRYYEAAWEFQSAAKLMPRKAEPQNNLGMVFEASGKLQEASDCYEKALALEPETHEATGNLARVRMRTSIRDDRTRQLLEEVARKDPRPTWVEWARQQLLSSRTENPSTQEAPSSSTIGSPPASAE